MELTPMQAIEILSLASQKAMLVKQDHIACEAAAKVLKDYLVANTPKKDDEG